MQLPLNVSPVSASFFGLQRLGIHLVLSLACVSLVSRSLPCFSLIPPAPPRPSLQRDLPALHTLAFLCFSLLSLLALAILK
jgi:hypothetical protein